MSPESAFLSRSLPLYLCALLLSLVEPYRTFSRTIFSLSPSFSSSLALPLIRVLLRYCARYPLLHCSTARCNGAWAMLEVLRCAASCHWSLALLLLVAGCVCALCEPTMRWAREIYLRPTSDDNWNVSAEDNWEPLTGPF